MTRATLLAIAGTAEPSDLWREFVGVAAAGYRPVLRSCTEGSTITGMADSLRASCSDEAIVMGHSLGALVALELALTRPAAVKGLILVSVSARADTPEQLIQRQRTLAWLEKGDVARWADAFIGRALPGGMCDAAAPSVRAMIMNRAASEIHAQQVATGARKDRRTELRFVQCPVVVVGGEKDGVTPFAHAKELAHGLPNARLRMMRNVGHFPMIERPDRLRPLLARAIDWIDRAGRHGCQSGAM